MKRLSTVVCALCFALTLAPVSLKAASAGESSHAAAVSGDARKVTDGITVVKDVTSQDGTRTIAAKPSSVVCSKQIEVSVKNGIISKVTFTGGCPGNTQGVAILVKGMKVQDAIKKLDNIDCAGRGTSCPDQLTDILKLFLK